MTDKEEVKQPESTETPVKDRTDEVLSKLSNLSSGIDYEYEDEPIDQLEGEKKAQEVPTLPEKEEEENPLIKAIETSKTKKEEVKEEPKVDTDKIKTEVLSEVTKLVTGKTPEELIKAKEETPIWVTEERDPTQKEIIEYTTEKAKREFRAEQEQERAKLEEEKNQQVEQEKTVEQQSKERAQASLQQMGRDVAELAIDGKLPPVVDETNKDDPGVVARNDLFTQFSKYAIPQWNAYNQAVKEGNNPDPLPMNAQNIRLFYYEKFKPTYNKVNPGTQAPIAGVVQEAFADDVGETDYSYDELLEARKSGALSLVNKSN